MAQDEPSMTIETAAYIRASHETPAWYAARRNAESAMGARLQHAVAHAERHALRALIEHSESAHEGSLDRFVIRAQRLERERVWADAHGGQVPHMKTRSERRREIMTALANAQDDESPDSVMGEQLIYLVAHANIDAIKVGTCIPSSSRIDDWESDGWEVIGVWGCRPDDAREIERAVITRWRVHYRAGYGGTPSDFRRSGITESAPLSCVSISDSVDVIRRMVRK